jgi:hypothetical protein
MTNWNDWVDEYYTIYPDAIGVRTIKLSSSDLKSPISCQQSGVIGASGLGARPLRVAGEKTAPVSDITAGTWPVFGSSDGPSYQVKDGLVLTPYAEDKTSKSWMMMVGLTDGTSIDPKSVASSWLSAPKLTATGCAYSCYDQAERAYQLACSVPIPVKLTIYASAGSPIVNPAFVIKGWGKTDISLAIDGKLIQRGPDFRYGFRKTDTGSDLIIWVKKQSTKPVTFEIKPVGGGK